MKYLVASDIHGSALGAKIVAQKFKQTKADKILLLGDILYQGPRNRFPDEYNPAETATVLNELAEKIVAVRGNCDSEVDQMVLDFTLNDCVMIELGKTSVFCTHGHHVSHENPAAKLAKGTVVVYGHFHRVSKTDIDGVTYINVGSIALPKQNSPKVYGILTEKKLEIFDVNDNLVESFCF